MPFISYRDNYDPEAMAILEAAFNEAWEVVTASGGDFNQESTRKALAELIISLAAEGETDPKRLKKLALAALPGRLKRIKCLKKKEAPARDRARASRKGSFAPRQGTNIDQRTRTIAGLQASRKGTGRPAKANTGLTNPAGMRRKCGLQGCFRLSLFQTAVDMVPAEPTPPLEKRNDQRMVSEVGNRGTKRDRARAPTMLALSRAPDPLRQRE